MYLCALQWPDHEIKSGVDVPLFLRIQFILLGDESQQNFRSKLIGFENHWEFHFDDFSLDGFLDVGGETETSFAKK